MAYDIATRPIWSLKSVIEDKNSPQENSINCTFTSKSFKWYMWLREVKKNINKMNFCTIMLPKFGDVNLVGIFSRPQTLSWECVDSDNIRL